jgi:hypothetical protein
MKRNGVTFSVSKSRQQGFPTANFKRVLFNYSRCRTTFTGSVGKDRACNVLHRVLEIFWCREVVL